MPSAILLYVDSYKILTLPAQYAGQGLCNGRASVRLSQRSTAPAVAGGFAAERPVGRRYQSIALGAGVQQQRRRSTALSSKCGQCHVDSRGTRLNRDLFAYALVINQKLAGQTRNSRRNTDCWSCVDCYTPSSHQICASETEVLSAHGSTASILQLLSLYPCRLLCLEVDLCLNFF